MPAGRGGPGRLKRLRVRAALFPARKTLEEFDFSFARSLKKQSVLHLARLDLLHAKDNVMLLGPPGTGKSHLAIAISIRACLAGQRVAFATATEWVARLGEAQRAGRLAPRSPAFGASRCWWPTRSATSPSIRRRPTSSSSWCRPATSGPR